MTGPLAFAIRKAIEPVSNRGEETTEPSEPTGTVAFLFRDTRLKTRLEEFLHKM